MNKAHIVNHYRKIWRDLHEVRGYIFAAIAIFVAGIILAIAVPSLGQKVIAAIMGYLKTFKHKAVLPLLIAIFLKNASSAFFAITLGILFGLVPIFGAVFNGIAVGAVLNMNPLNFFLLLPHGIFELTATFIAWGLGIWCGLGLFHTPSLETINLRIKKSLNIYVSVIVPLLVIAAIIEVLGIKYYSTFK
jgi:stage II sporulation protein M